MEAYKASLNYVRDFIDVQKREVDIVAITGTDVFGEIQPAWRVTISDEFLRIEESCARAARCQFETVKTWRVTHLWLSLSTMTAAGVAGSMVLATHRFSIVAGSLALVAAMLTAITSMVGTARKESRAAEAAKAYKTIDTLARQARQVDLPGQIFEQARQSLAELTERWQAANRLALPVPRSAQGRADRNTYCEKVEDAVLEKMSDVVSVFHLSPKTVDRIS